MVQLVATNELREQLGDLTAPIELLDRRGTLLATIVPSAVPTTEDYERAKVLFTDEELDRASAEVGGSTTQEVLAKLLV